MSEKKLPKKYCVVPECPNTTRNAPEKLFISVPSDPATRKVWQKAMRRDVFVSDKSHVYCCEDHFNLKEDIENYMYVKTMNEGKIRLRPKVVPRFFDCQKNRVTAHRSKLEPTSQFLQKKEHQCLIDNLLYPETLEIENKDIKQENGMEIESKEVGIQVTFKPKFRSKGVQCSISEDLPLSKKRKRRCKERIPKKIRLKKESTDPVSTSGSTSMFILSEQIKSDPDSDIPKLNSPPES